MNTLRILEGIHKDTESVLMNSMSQNITMNLDSYTRHLNELCRYDFMTYSEIINNDPLTSWVISTMMPYVKIRPFIRFSKEFMLNNIHLYEPYLSKWLEYLIGLCDEEEEYYDYGYNKHDFVAMLNLPYYINNRVDSAPDEGFFRYIFEDIANALARNDYAAYIDMCLEVTRCIETAMMESKEVI